MSVARKKLLLLFIMGLVYYFLLRYTDVSIPCVFRSITGYKCPGCGITTMLLLIADGNFAAARAENIFLYYTLLPLLLAVCVRYSTAMKIYHRYLDKVCFPLYLVALLAFGVYRNM